MAARHIAYALIPNISLIVGLGVWDICTNCIRGFDAFGFIFLMVGLIWWSTMLFCGLLFHIAADAKRWRPLFIGLGMIIFLPCCALAGSGKSINEALALGLLPFSALCLLGWLAGVLVEKALRAFRYVKKNAPSLRQWALNFIIAALKDAVE